MCHRFKNRIEISPTDFQLFSEQTKILSLTFFEWPWSVQLLCLTLRRYSTFTHPSDQLRLLNCPYAINVAANKYGVNRRQNMLRASRPIMHERITSQVRTLLCLEDEAGEEWIEMLVHQVLHGCSSVRPPKYQSSAWYRFPPFSHSLSL